MSKIVVADHDHDLVTLSAEIEAAIPELTPEEVTGVPLPPGMTGPVYRARWSLSSTGTTIRAEIPDDVDEADVLAVIEAHDASAARQALAARQEAEQSAVDAAIAQRVADAEKVLNSPLLAEDAEGRAALARILGVPGDS